MRTIRHLRLGIVALAAGVATAGTALAYDSLGGFDQAYTNGGNLFGHGAWGDGSGTALPLPGPRPEFGFHYGRPYDGGNNLFGSGFWTAEYMVRRGETLSTVRETISTTESVIEGGPLGESHAGDGLKGGKGHGGKGYKDKGKKHEKPMKPKEKVVVREVVKTIEKARTRYIPYARREIIAVPRNYSSVVVIERPQSVELGDLEVTLRTRAETFGAVCITGKGDEVDAIVVNPNGTDAAYEGEIFRCPGDSMLRVSYATEAADMVGSVRLEDGTSYVDCDPGHALARAASGDLLCAPKRRMDGATERALARSGHGSVSGARGEAVDLSGLQLTGGVGNTGGAY